MLRKAVEANAGLRRHRARRARAVHVGRDAARGVPQQHQDHRSDGRVRAGSRASAPARPLFGGATADDGGRTARRSSPASCRICAARCRRTGASIAHYDGGEDAIAFANAQVGGVALPDGHELSRSFPAHAHLAAVSCRSTPRPTGSPALKTRIAERLVQYRAGLRRLLQGACAARIRRRCAIRIPSVVVIPGLGLFGFGKDKREARITSEFFVNAIHVMSGANALGAASGGQGEGRAAAGAASRSRRPSSRASRTTSRCRGPRRSGSSTGRSRKPSCSACRPSASSAARSSSSSAARAASAGKSRCRSPSAAATSSSPT